MNRTKSINSHSHTLSLRGFSLLGLLHLQLLVLLLLL
ncbi:hypothetical protein NEF87_002999 [Candidatus Lokiarchaeum ossiferum]|uniref:Uncharacterized protein n=1 Tax=Candidatus Lokiarchaeum ossiferum TaxID=2951803 RepID=A0ABY6HVX1_9ARCH|nr:hypothetical protein NEF87_002999 [Candidatus Lokiarchaeum sp. B-35]